MTIICVVAGGIVLAVFMTQSEPKETTYEKYRSEMRILRTYSVQYKNKQSDLYMSTAEQFCGEITSMFKKSEVRESYHECEVVDIRNGSLLIDYVVTMARRDADWKKSTSRTPASFLGDIVNRNIADGTLGSFPVDRNKKTLFKKVSVGPTTETSNRVATTLPTKILIESTNIPELTTVISPALDNTTLMQALDAGETMSFVFNSPTTNSPTHSKSSTTENMDINTFNGINNSTKLDNILPLGDLTTPQGAIDTTQNSLTLSDVMTAVSVPETSIGARRMSTLAETSPSLFTYISTRQNESTLIKETTMPITTYDPFINETTVPTDNETGIILNVSGGLSLVDETSATSESPTKSIREATTDMSDVEQRTFQTTTESDTTPTAQRYEDTSSARTYGKITQENATAGTGTQFTTEKSTTERLTKNTSPPIISTAVEHNNISLEVTSPSLMKRVTSGYFTNASQSTAQPQDGFPIPNRTTLDTIHPSTFSAHDAGEELRLTTQSEPKNFTLIHQHSQTTEKNFRDKRINATVTMVNITIMERMLNGTTDEMPTTETMQGNTEQTPYGTTDEIPTTQIIPNVTNETARYTMNITNTRISDESSTEGIASSGITNTVTELTSNSDGVTKPTIQTTTVEYSTRDTSVNYVRDTHASPERPEATTVTQTSDHTQTSDGADILDGTTKQTTTEDFNTKTPTL